MSAAAHIANLEQTNAKLAAELVAVNAVCEQLKQQLAWLQRQVFGEKSEKRIEIDEQIQPSLLSGLGVPEAGIPPLPPTEVITYARRAKVRGEETVNPAGLRFTDAAIIEEVLVDDPAMALVPESERERIGEKVTFRIAQRSSSYVVLKFIRPVYKLKASGEIVTAPLPPAIFEGCTADVSAIAGLLADKGLYHLPIYRQHQRMGDGGFMLSRQTPLNWAGRGIDLLVPIVEAQASHILHSQVLAMDETPIKAGHAGQGKMKKAYYWPIYGEDDEVVFHFSTTRRHAEVPRLLGDFRGTLISDGYGAYEAYAKKHRDMTHAQCWAHARREFEEAKASDPVGVDEALTLIGALYRHEGIIREQNLVGEAKRQYRVTHSAPALDGFWNWHARQLLRADLIPKHPFAMALKYVQVRQAALRVFIADPAVPIDTNHLERAIRPIPKGVSLCSSFSTL